MSRPALGLTEPSIQGVLGIPSLWAKQVECEGGHLPPSSEKVKKTSNFTFPSLHDARAEERL